MSPAPSTAPAAALAAFLAAHRDPLAGAALYDAYAPDAPLCFRAAIAPRHAVDRAEFAWCVAAHARLHGRLHGGEPPRPALGAERLLAVQAEAERALVWFAAPETVSGREETGVAGLLRTDAGWRVDFVTLAEAQQPWGYDLARAQALADVFYAETNGLTAPRGWLDIAYFRLRLLPRPAFLTLPEARFSCHGSAACCTIGFRIALPASAQAVLDAVPWGPDQAALTGHRLEPLPEGQVLLKAHDERCRFLDAEKRCELHKVLGRAPFPACASYPVEFMPTPDGLATTTVMTCPSARAPLGPKLSERGDDLAARHAIRKPPAGPAAYRLAAGHEVPWATFKAAEEELLAILDDPGLGYVDKLYAGLRALHARLGEPLPAERPLAPTAERAGRLGVVTLMAAVIQPDAPAAGPDAGLPREGAQADELARLMRSLIFSKKLSFEHDLLTAWHFVILGSLIAFRLRPDEPDGRIPQDAMWRLMSFLFHHGPFEKLAPDPAERAALQADFASPGWGLYLLAAVPAPTPA